MLCELCKKKEATIHLTQVLDGSVKKVHMCEECSEKSGFDAQGPTSITDILLGMGGEGGLTIGTQKSLGRSCPKCQMKLSSFKKSGRFGCPDCYDAFKDELAPLLKVMHRKDVHIGKIPSRESAMVQRSAELSSLEKELNDAVKTENYEEAARIRDRIKECKLAMKEPEDSGGDYNESTSNDKD